MLSPEDFFALENYEHREIFDNCLYVWEALKNISAYIEKFSFDHKKYSDDISGTFLDFSEYIYIGKGTVIEPGAYIKGPAIIGENCEIRSGAYIRGCVICGKGCVIGHTTEMKNVIMLDNAKAPHFNYCGDSIIGNNTNLGAGTILSNLPLNSERDPQTGRRPSITIKINNTEYDTGLSKLGAVIGDGAKTGCNCVLNPGTLLGREVAVYPCVSVRRGCYEKEKIIK